MDYGKILALASELAKADDSKLRFSVDASHVDRLGRELVQKRETALAELVKNSYDADAKLVEVTFKNADDPGGTLVISDTGTGMTRQELIDGFMRISSPEKIVHPFSPGNRRRAGSKGIGRFSAQRLGSALLIETHSSPKEQGWRVRIDWEAFQRNLDLTTVGVEVERIPPAPCGTRLTIENLREAWPREDLEGVAKSLAPLMQPFPLSHVQSSVDDAFSIAVTDSAGKDVPIAVAYERFFDYALAIIDAKTDSTGRARLSVSSSRLDVDVQDSTFEQDKPYAHLRDVRLRVYYYIISSEFFPRGPDNQHLRVALRNQGGIRLYRNGFRVSPYGEEGDDWLGLDAYYRKRSTVLEPIGNGNVFGFIEISDSAIANFQETSSREGLVRSPAFAELADFGFESILQSVRIIERARTKRRPEPRSNAVEIKARLRALEPKIEELATARGPRRKELAQEISVDVKALRRDVGELERYNIEESGMLRVLATLGITVSEFIHEVRNSITNLEAGALRLIERSTDSKHKGLLTSVIANMKLLRTYTGYFTRVITDNEERSTHALEMHDVLTHFKNFSKPIADERGIKLETKIDSIDVWCRPMHQSEWSSILLNLLSNSFKAIKRTSNVGVIRAHASTDGRRVTLDFMDNGDGIPRENWEQVFEAFFSTTKIAPTRRENPDNAAGMGLGLKIVRDIITANGGTVAIVEPPDAFSTCVRIQIPAATKRQTDAANA
ncbi:MAG: sensor histidine kinase [Vulcanimicrobiaceae bacterium]